MEWSYRLRVGKYPYKGVFCDRIAELGLDMLDKKDLRNIRYKRVNEKTGKEVAWENICLS